MSKAELHKSIEARKLNARSGLPLKEPPVMIPYAAILERIELDRDLVRFYYLGERYICKYQELREASGNMAEPEPAAKSPADAPVAAAPARQVMKTEDSATPAAAPTLTWESLNSPQLPARRAKVPGGWLVAAGTGLCFYPDPGHQWSGASE